MSTALLTDPFLTAPRADGVDVVWFTEFSGLCHLALVGEWVRDLDLANAIALARSLAREDPPGPGVLVAESLRIDQLAEDADSVVATRECPTVTERPVWRHVAAVHGLDPGSRTPYRVLSAERRDTARAGIRVALSEVFTLAAAPEPGSGQRVLLTSDHQQLPMVAANLTKAAEVAGIGPDGISAVFCAGDMVEVPDRASDWFDRADGRAFFPALQGHGESTLAGRTWRGAPIIQQVPLYPAIGNHEVMGRRLAAASLRERFDHAWPRHVAETAYAATAAAVNPSGDPEIEARWMSDHSFNTCAYERIFDPPRSSGSPRYYATTVGNIHLIVLCAAAIWRPPARQGAVPGKYDEPADRLDRPDTWGHGQPIVEPLDRDSAQYAWLRAQLASPECQRAEYRVVMCHQPPHGIGFSVAPAFTDPVQHVERDARTGATTRVRYEYPAERDYLLRDIEPLLAAHGVQLVISGHTHLWNRFRSEAGVHFLESSNIGNTHGAYLPGHLARDVPDSAEGFTEHYVAQGDPGGLEPIVPTVAPRHSPTGEPEPFIASDTITVFSILDTVDGVVRSYGFDTSQPDGDTVLFDEFELD